MADTIKTTKELKIENYFVDGDTRTIVYPNPRSDITSTEISELNSFIQENNLLVGDKAGATFGRINKVDRVTKTITGTDEDLFEPPT